MKEKLSYRGAVTDHGGYISPGVSHNIKVLVSGVLRDASLDGDPHPCPLCEVTSSVVATGFAKFNGIKMTKIGDKTTCGATVIAPCDNAFSD